MFIQNFIGVIVKILLSNIINLSWISNLPLLILKPSVSSDNRIEILLASSKIHTKKRFVLTI